MIEQGVKCTLIDAHDGVAVALDHFCGAERQRKKVSTKQLNDACEENDSGSVIAGSAFIDLYV